MSHQWRGEEGERAVRTRRKPGGGKRRFAAWRAHVLDPYIPSTASKHNEVMAVVFVCFDRRVVRHAGWCPRSARTAVPAARSLLSCALWGGMGRLWRGMGGILRIVGRTRSALRRAPFAVRCEIPQKWTKSRISERKHEAQRSPRFPSPLGRVRAAWRGRGMRGGGEWGVSQCPRAFRCGERQMNPC